MSQTGQTSDFLISVGKLKDKLKFSAKLSDTICEGINALQILYRMGSPVDLPTFNAGGRGCYL
jgi:hypothetical protein